MKKPGRGPALRGGGRFDLYEIVARIERRRIELGLTRTALAAAAGIDLSSYSHKVGMTRNSFSITEIGLIADCLAAASRDPLPGWPFISEDHSRLLDRALRAPGAGSAISKLRSIQ